MAEKAILLVIGYVWPEPNSSAAGNRMIQLLQLFQQAQYNIVFASAAQKSSYEYNLADLGIEEKAILLNHSSFDEFLVNLQPQLVLFDRYFIEEQFGWRISKICPKAIKILDTEDLHFLRHARQKAWKENRLENISDLQSDYAKREIASILRCDTTLVISRYELDLLVNVFKIDANLLFYLPLLIEPHSNTLPAFEERTDFIFIGNFLHEPNWQAVRYLKEQVWPILGKLLPQVSMQIYGAYPSQKVLQLHEPKQGFFIQGRATHAAQKVQEARVSLAPLFFGAGLKGKLLEAMQNGTPSVTTWVGAEGIETEDNWPGFIASTPETFAKAAVQLYTNPDSWMQAQNRGFEILQTQFRKDLFADSFIDHISFLREHIVSHREANFIGAILQHHTMASTTYLSRWIEEKSKHV